MLVGKVTGVPSPVALILVFAMLLEQLTPGTSQRQKSKEEELYEKRPYKFQFNIEEHHHRKEEKNDKGIIMGEFGFVTADFFYLTTVYATDEEGKFHILSRSRKYIGPPTEKPPTKSAALPNRPAAPPTPPPPPASPPSKTKKPGGPFSGLIGCGSCVVPTTTKKPSPGSNVNAGGRPSFPGAGIKPPGGQEAGGVLPPKRPSTFGQSEPTRPGKPTQPGFGRPSDSLGPSKGAPNKPGSVNPNTGGSTGANLLPGSRPGDKSQNTIGKGPQGLEGSVLTPGDKGGPNYKFNYTVGFHGHHETGYKGGSKEGGYFANYRDGEGQKVIYEANEFGYQPNVTKIRLSDEETPKIETEKDYGLKGYEFKWFN